MGVFAHRAPCKEIEHPPREHPRARGRHYVAGTQTLAMVPGTMAQTVPAPQSPLVRHES